MFTLLSLIMYSTISTNGMQISFLCPSNKHIDQIDIPAKRVTAIIDFDGLEHTYISGLSCPKARMVEMKGGFSLDGKMGKTLYENIISSYRKSNHTARYVVKFTGIVKFGKSKNGDLESYITKVYRSSLVRLKQ